MAQDKLHDLSRREREMMNIIYRLQNATAADVHEAMKRPPSYSAVRATLRILEEKGLLRHREDGPRYVYFPTVPLEKARQSALRGLLTTFFDDSPEKAMAALLDLEAKDLDESELDRLQSMIDRKRRKKP